MLARNILMTNSLSVLGITDSDFPMSSIIGRANLLVTTSNGGGYHEGIKMTDQYSMTCYNKVIIMIRVNQLLSY